MFDYYNGHNTIEVDSLDKLDSLSQDEVNNLASGPQDEFFQKLDTLNAEMSHYDVKPVDVTDKWNWRPGSYDRVREYLAKRLEIDRKCMSMDKLMTRTIDKVNYLGFIKRQAEYMELERATLKRLGVGKDVDIDKFKEKCKEFVDNICSQCEKAYNSTNGKVSIVPYVEIVGRHAKLYYDITLTGLTFSVYDNKKCIQEIPLNDIHIVVNQSLRHVINGLRTDVGFIGKYVSKGVDLHFAYIASNYRGSQSHSTVCLDKHHDDICKSIRSGNLVLTSIQLMQWAQFYNIKRANPYNQPYMSHLGMPEGFSKEYKAVADEKSVADRCSSRLNNYGLKLELYQHANDEMINATCNNIGCQIKSICKLNIKVVNRLSTMNSEYGRMVEGLIGTILTYVPKDELNGVLNLITGDDLPVWKYKTEDSGIWKDDGFETFINEMINRFYNYFMNSKGFCTYTYDFLEKYKIIDKGAIKVTVPKEPLNVEELETIMKQWAETQGR